MNAEYIDLDGYRFYLTEHGAPKLIEYLKQKDISTNRTIGEMIKDYQNAQSERSPV